MNNSNLMDRSQSSSSAGSMPSVHTVAPPVDVFENADELLIVVDVPGATSDGIDVQLHNGQLTIQAKRSTETIGLELTTEYRPDHYFRVFSLPSGIDATKVDAQLAAGVLKVHLPKASAVKPRRIEVKAG